jgi:bla regulator protein BlaR1
MTPWVMNHLWQSTLFVALVWLATLVFRRNRARVRYCLWMAASVKFLVPVSVLVSLGERLKWTAPPVSVQPAVSFVMEDLLMPAAVVAAPVSIPQFPPVFLWLFLAVWSAGLAFVLMSWWRNWVPIRSALRQATPVRLGPDYDVADLRVFSSPTMQDVGVVGIRSPVLLLPEGLTDRLSPAQFRALIAHERCHISWHDNLVAALHVIIEALFWFHPLVWLIEKRLIDERERACDEAVLRAGNHPDDYAIGILEVSQHAVESRVLWLAGITGSDLRRRVESIMRQEIGRPMTAGRQLALGLGVVVAFGLPVVGGAMKVSTLSQQNQVSAGQLPPSGNEAKFEVASIRPNKSGAFAMNGGRPFKGRTYRATNIPLRNVIALSYGIPAAQVLDGPSWIGAASVDARFIGGDRFDITATLPEGASVDQVPSMLRALLADRFKFRAHSENRDVPMYGLVVARSDGRLGAQLRKASIDCEAARAAGADIPAPKPGERGVCDSEVGGEIIGRGQRLSALAGMLSLFAGRPVVDRTGLTGGFDFDLRFPELNTRPEDRGPGGGDPLIGIFPALQEQLGLKLESIRGNLEVLVIDSVEHPTEN